MKNEKRLSKKYLIPFTGLKLGIHHFEFEIEDEFFQIFEGSLVESGTAEIKLSLEKLENRLQLHVALTGAYPTLCDSCGDFLEVPIEIEDSFIVKFSNVEDDSSENIISLPESAYELDVAPIIYELFAVALPAKMVHEEGECNQEALDRLEEINDIAEEGEDIDPRWSQLKDLKNKD